MATPPRDDRGDIDAARARALGVVTSLPEMKMKLYTLAEILGKHPGIDGIGRAGDEVAQLTDLESARALLHRYQTETIEALNGKRATDLTIAQQNALADVLSTIRPAGTPPIMRPDGEANEAREEEKRRKLIEALAELTGEKHDYTSLIGGFVGVGITGGALVGGEKPILGRAALDNIRTYGDEGQRLADKYSAPLLASADPRAVIVDFARRFRGESERNSNNTGPLVKMCMGYEGDPYCGGGMKMVYGRVFGALFDQKSFRSAGSWAQMGAAHNAMTNNPKPGDIVLFHSAYARSGYHVGMITDAGPPVKYLDFNGGDTVKEATLNRAAAGFVSIEALAASKFKDDPEFQGKSGEEILRALIERAQREFETLQRAEAPVQTVTGTRVAAVGDRRPETAPAL